uniref:Cadherin domain-containing protein n=1 Tax=Malurus cyaneus samueli TaxID=2593467 RepID=A0A8C5TUI6_9PASS
QGSAAVLCVPVPRSPCHFVPCLPVSFVDCGDRTTLCFSRTTRFKVSRDGVVSATRPLQLQRRQLRAGTSRTTHGHGLRHKGPGRSPVFYSSITGQGADTIPVGVFIIERETGWLKVTKPLDREEKDKYVVSGGVSVGDGTVLGMNRPVFTQQVFVGYIERDAKPGTHICDDPDVHHKPRGIIAVICTGLDREVSTDHSQYTLIIQAADQEALPSSYEDSVNENEPGLLVARLHVKDQDLPGSPAWRAVYRIQSGDPQGNFEITTDPKTNDGLLKTAKGLDYETQKQYKLVVSVENEVPFTVKLNPSTASVQVFVKDVNEDPVFIPTVKKVEVMEDVPVGYQITSYTAQDPDKEQNQKITYRMGSDPAGWLAIDPENGIVTAAQPLDRESTHAINSTYKAIVLAVDNGSPKYGTGTGTLLLLLQDVNDNGPVPEPRSFDICNRQPEEQTLNIIDKDLPPNTFPFRADSTAAARRTIRDPRPAAPASFHPSGLTVVSAQGGSTPSNTPWTQRPRLPH